MSHLRGKKHRESLQMKCLSEQVRTCVYDYDVSVLPV